MPLQKISSTTNATELVSAFNNNVDELGGGVVSGDGTYYGERICLNPNGLTRTLLQTLPNAVTHQSLAIFGYYGVLVTGSGTLSLYNIKTNARIADVNLPSASGFSTPHANVAQFGVEHGAGNATLPLLYVSQWNNERGFIAYNLTASGSISVAQTIKSSVSANIFGSGQADWVIDTDRGLLYSIAYKQADGYAITEADGGRTMVCKFKLPKIADGAAIVLTDADVLDSFELPPMQVRQDACYCNGRVLLVAGGGSSSAYDTSWNKLYSIDMQGKRIASVVDLYSYLAAEPEGLSLYDGKLLMTYNTSPYGRLFAYEF